MVDKDRVAHPQGFVFEFASVEERDGCSREISRLLAASLGTSEALIKLRAACLVKDKDLLKLHQELVGHGLLSEEEFWESRNAVLERELISQSQDGKESIGQALSLPGSKKGANIYVCMYVCREREREREREKHHHHQHHARFLLQGCRASCCPSWKACSQTAGTVRSCP